MVVTQDGGHVQRGAADAGQWVDVARARGDVLLCLLL